MRGLVRSGRSWLQANAVLRSMLGVGSATVLSQVIALAISPVLSRLYPPAVFGAFGVFLAFANIVATICLAGLSDAVIAAREDDDALMVARLGAWLLALLLLPALLFSLVAIRLGWLGLGALPKWSLWLLMAEVIVLTATSYYQALLVRKRRFKRLSQAYLLNGGGRAGAQLLGGLAAMGLAGMAAGEIVGRSLSLGMMHGALRGQFSHARTFTPAQLLGAVRRYRHFPLARMPSAVLSAIAVGAPQLMVASLYGAKPAGAYALVALVLTAPLALVQRTVGDVFLGHFGHRFRTDHAAAMRLLWQTVGALALAAALMSGVLLAIGPRLFALFFGAQWAVAGAMAQAALPMVFAQLAVLPVSAAINVANRPEVKLFFDISYLGALFAVLTIAHAALPPPITFVLWMSGGVGAATAFFFVLVLWACYRPRAVQPH